MGKTQRAKAYTMKHTSKQASTVLILFMTLVPAHGWSYAMRIPHPHGFQHPMQRFTTPCPWILYHGEQELREVARFFRTFALPLSWIQQDLLLVLIAFSVAE